MSVFSLRRLLPLALFVGSSLAITSCVVRERPVYVRDHDRHYHDDHHDDHRDYDRH